MIPQEIYDQYEPTIGIECHVQLRTKSKLFSGADNDARAAAPNTVVSPICFGLPGTLPVLNKEAVTLAIRAGVAMNAEIAKVSSFDRKHYFYPDLPKGYQITQLERPTVGRGYVIVPLGQEEFKVRITRAHIEEDAGKLTHPEGADYSLVDLNRAGTPLIEIVSEADMHSATQAKAYVQELYLLMKYAGVTYGDLYHGNMRFDVNISVAKKGSGQLGTRAEVKNLNSFRSVEKAADYEFKRQVEVLHKGGEIKQETRGWSDAKQRTFSQRSKEEAQDYRYFPEADIPPIELSEQVIAAVRADMPSLPPALRADLQALGLDRDSAETLLLRSAIDQTDYVQSILTLERSHNKTAALFAAKFLVNRFIAKITEGTQASSLPSAKQFADTYTLYAENKLSSNAADDLLFLLAKTPQANSLDVAEQHNLLQENDMAALEKVVAEVLQAPASQKAVADVKNGEMKAIGYLVGQVMKASKGTANPAVVSGLIRKLLA